MQWLQNKAPPLPTECASGLLPGPTRHWDRQRTLAYRFGVNHVMYALTGNYKGDRPYVLAIL
jgi:hypothetical protein